MFSPLRKVKQRVFIFLQTPAGVRAFGVGYVLLAVLLKWGHLVEQDEGYTLTEAWQVTNGLVPYRDFFDYLTPGSLYLLAALFWLFGTSYVVAKIFSIVLIALGGYGIYRLGKYLALGWVRFLPPLLWLFLTDHHVLINYKPYVLVAGIWALERILAARAADASEEKSSLPLVFVAGLLSGIAIMVHQARGAAIAAAAIIFFVVFRRFRALPPYLVGTVLPLLLLLAWPISVLWSHLLYFPFSHYLPYDRTGPWLLVALLVGYVLVGWVWRRWRMPSPTFTLLWLAGVILLLSDFGRPDSPHLLPVLFPLPLLLAAVYQQAGRAGDGMVQRATAAVLVVGSVGLSLASLTMLTQRITAIGWFNFIQLRDPQLEKIVSYIQTNVQPDEPIFVVPYLPNFYFEAQRRNPTRYNNLMYGYNTPEQFAAAARALAVDPPVLVLTNGYNAPDDPVTVFIRQNYSIEQEISTVRIYRRAH